jgi:hypothetical protein
MIEVHVQNENPVSELDYTDACNESVWEKYQNDQ